MVYYIDKNALLSYPAICKECGGKCCGKYPYMQAHELAKMREVVGDTITDENITDVKNGFFKLNILCPCYDPERGCILDIEDRPMVCRLYPFSPIPCSGDKWILLLDVAVCPAWTFFGTKYQDAVKLFVELMK